MITPEVLVDTNILIAHLAGQERLSVSPSQVGISAITMFEMLSLPGISESEQTKIRSLLALMSVFSVTSAVAERASTLARTRTKRHVLDLLIAATALELDVPLVTKNIKDFRNVPGLKVKTTLT